jgi:hypothetical protein
MFWKKPKVNWVGKMTKSYEIKFSMETEDNDPNAFNVALTMVFPRSVIQNFKVRILEADEIVTSRQPASLEQFYSVNEPAMGVGQQSDRPLPQ